MIEGNFLYLYIDQDVKGLTGYTALYKGQLYWSTYDSLTTLYFTV